MVVIPNRDDLVQNSVNNSNNSNINRKDEGNIVAERTYNELAFVLRVPQDRVAIIRNNFNGNIKVIEKKGWNFCLPFIYTKVLIKTTGISNVVSVDINSKDYSSVPMKFNVDFSIRDYVKFFNEFCGGLDVKDILYLNDSELQKLNNRVLTVLRDVVSANLYEDVQKINIHRKTTQAGETLITKGVKEQADDLRESLNRVYADYGIFFNEIRLVDIEKPKELLDQERKEKNNESENRMKIANAKAREESSKHDLETAKNEAESIRVKRKAEYASPIEAYEDHQYTPEQAAMFEAMKNSNLKVMGNSMPFINVDEETKGKSK